MTNTPRITFFMLVTNRDCMIAHFAIRSYVKIYALDQQFILFVYLNCVTKENKERYVKTWSAYPFTVIFDNADKDGLTGDIFPGQEIVSPEGMVRQRDDFAESYDELWTTELKKFDTALVATVDADFEIFNPAFYFDLLEHLDRNPRLIGASSNYSPTSVTHDSYSNRTIMLSERNHTWFCIYRREAFALSQRSHFYFEQQDANREIFAYDSSAYFQEELRTRYHRSFAETPTALQHCFLHYGAASKNQSINRRNVRVFRSRYRLSAIGLFAGKRNPFKNFINSLTRKVAQKVFGRYLNKLHRERSVYIYQEKDR